MRALLISTYDLGHQPFGLASPAAWLREAGVDVTCVDLTRQALPLQQVRQSDVAAFFLPMHTATRLALPVIDEVRSLNPSARLIAYGLYAPLNASLLRERGVGEIVGAEFEEDLVSIVVNGAVQGGGALPRLQFRVPERGGLPPLATYATLQVGAEQRVAGYTEASRGCKHRCRHCPIVPVYDGHFRVVQPEVVLADVRAQAAAGARHITFGDPDFFNGPRHAAAVVSALARECPGITYDVTIKVEHLLRHADLLPLLRDTGCAFVTSAVESLDDHVLAKLDKGHTRADFERVVALCRTHGLALSPTFVAFTPWTTIDRYLELLQTIDRLDLVGHVAPIQLAIRLLIPQGSRLLELPDVRGVIAHYDPRWLTYVWRHPDPRLDALQREVEHLVGVRMQGDRASVFDRIWTLAHDRAGIAAERRRTAGLLPRAAVPYLNEPWYC